MFGILTQQQVDDTISYIQKVVTDYHNEMGFTFSGNVISYDVGKRYIRIVSTNTGRYVYGFIDTTNGDLLKSAGWKAPAKNFARGNIIQGKLDCCGHYGIS